MAISILKFKNDPKVVIVKIKGQALHRIIDDAQHIAYRQYVDKSSAEFWADKRSSRLLRDCVSGAIANPLLKWVVVWRSTAGVDFFAFPLLTSDDIEPTDVLRLLKTVHHTISENPAPLKENFERFSGGTVFPELMTNIDNSDAVQEYYYTVIAQEELDKENNIAPDLAVERSDQIIRMYPLPSFPPDDLDDDKKSELFPNTLSVLPFLLESLAPYYSRTTGPQLGELDRPRMRALCRQKTGVRGVKAGESFLANVYDTIFFSTTNVSQPLGAENGLDLAQARLFADCSVASPNLAVYQGLGVPYVQARKTATETNDPTSEQKEAGNAPADADPQTEECVAKEQTNEGTDDGATGHVKKQTAEPTERKPTRSTQLIADNSSSTAITRNTPKKRGLALSAATMLLGMLAPAPSDANQEIESESAEKREESKTKRRKNLAGTVKPANTEETKKQKNLEQALIASLGGPGLDPDVRLDSTAFSSQTPSDNDGNWMAGVITSTASNSSFISPLYSVTRR